MHDLLRQNPDFTVVLSFTGPPRPETARSVSVAGSDESDLDGSELTATGCALIGFHCEEVKSALLRAWEVCRLHLSLDDITGAQWVCAINRDLCTFLPASRHQDISSLSGIRNALLPPVFRDATPRLAGWTGLAAEARPLACAPAFGPHLSNHAAICWPGTMQARLDAIQNALFESSTAVALPEAE